MSDQRIVISFSTEGIPQTRNDIDKLQKRTTGGFTELNNAFEVMQKALAGVQGVATSLYSALIDSNEKLNAELLKSQTNLASNLEIYRDGTEIVDITEKIVSTQNLLKDSLKQIEQDTKSLVGVTTDQVNGVFQVLLQNSQKFIGQSKEFSDPIEAATASTKNWAAALGTLGIPLEQANQEIRSILQGDVNNPDSIIAKTLQISREQYDQWVANGELIDQLNSKLEVFTAGNALASQSIAGVTSNLTSLVEDTARLVGEPLLAPVVTALNDIYKLMEDNIKLVEELAGDNIQQVVSLMETLRQTTAKVAESLDINPEGFLTGGSQLLGNLIVAIEAIIELGGGLVVLIGDDLSYAFNNATAVLDLTLEGIAKLANFLNIVVGGIGDFVDALDKIPGLDLGEVLGNAQTGVAKLTGEYQQSIEAVGIYNDITGVLLAQTDKLSKSQNASEDSIKSQIAALQTQKAELESVKTFRDADAQSVQAQVDAIDKAIAGLNSMTQATGELSFKSKELAEVGTIYDTLAAKAEAAAGQIASEGSGDAAVFKESIDALTELTEKQVEYGQITITEASERLNSILGNNKIELEQRESVLQTLRQLEQDFTDFKLAELQQQADALNLLAETGQISERESLDQVYANENTQLQLQIDLLDRQIEQNTELGISSQQLAQQKAGLLQQQLQAEVEYSESVVDLQAEALDRAYDQTLRLAEESELARTIALTRGLIDRSISEDEFNSQQLNATKQRLNAELAAEKAQVTALQALVASASTVDQQRELQSQIDEAKLNSAQITKQLLDVELDAQKQIQEALQKTIDKRNQAIADSIDAQKLALTKRISDESQLQDSLVQLTVDRINAELAAEKQAQNELAALNDADGVEASLRKQTQLKISLIEAEKSAEASKLSLVKEGLDKQLQATEDEFKARELAIRQSVSNESEYQSQLAELTVARINAQLEAELNAQAELEAAGDTEGAEESKRKQRQLAINLIDAEIAAEKSLQSIISSQLDEYRKRLDLQKQSAEVKLLDEELKLEKAVIAGRITKEKAEIAKLNIVKKRVAEELAILQQLEGQGDEAAQIANQQAIAKAKIESLRVTQQINEATKDAATQAALEKITLEYESQSQIVEDVASQLSHINQLIDLQGQSVARVNQLRESQVNLANAQVGVLEAGLGNELSLVNKSLSARQKLNDIQSQLADSELPEEKQIELLNQQKAIKAQLAVLGSDGLKSEVELIIERQAIEQQQLASKQAQFDISQQQAALTLENQRASIQLDQIKASNKAQELALEAELLAIKAEQLQAEARLTEDSTKRNQLLQQAASIDKQSERTAELAVKQTEAAEQEAAIRTSMLDQQEVISKLQADSQQESLDTQKTLLDAQQAYEASIEGFNPKINTKSLDDFSKKVGKIKTEFNEAIKIDNVPLDVQIPVQVTPANLDVRVTDNQLSNSISKLSSGLNSQATAMTGIRGTVSGLGGKLDSISRALATQTTGSGASTTVKPVVNNNIQVTVSPTGQVGVSSTSLIDERKAEAGC